MKKKTYKNFLGVVAIILVLYLVVTEVSASENEGKMDLLLDSTVDLEQVKTEILEINPDSEVIIIPEIYLIRIEGVNEKEKAKITNNDYIHRFIIEQGTLPSFEVDQYVAKDLSESNSNIQIYNNIDLNRMTEIEFFEKMGWHIDKVTNNRESLELSQGENVSIALIDSGIDTTHPVLQEQINVDKGKSYVEGDADVTDTNGHGTMVAGILAQIVPKAQLVPYRVIGDSSGESLWTIEAIIDAADDGNEVINMSLGTYKATNDTNEAIIIDAFQRAINYAKSKGKIVVASAGNEGRDLDQYYEEDGIIHLPGSLDGVISVSAENNNNLPSYSNYGSDITFTAPGGDMIFNNDGILDLNQLVYCTYPTSMSNGLEALGIPQGYTFSYGTSLSTPAVSAGLASIISIYKKNALPIQSDEIVAVLKDNCVDLGEFGCDRFFGNGLIEINNSLSSILYRNN